MRSTRRGMLLFVAIAALATASMAGCGDSTTKPNPSATYPNASLLVTGAWLAANATAANVVVVDVRADTTFADGHIPHAISLPVTYGGGLFDKGGGGLDATDLKTPAEIAAVLGAAGISKTTTIVVYGGDIDWLVGRMFWMLEYLGATDVRMLDGGYSKWIADGRATSTAITTHAATTFTPAVVASRLATKADVLAHYADTAGYAIVDSRNAEHYAPSHVPHALNILMGDLLNADLTAKSYADLKDVLDGKGVTSGKTVITYCYIGYRSGQEYFIFRLMGHTVSNYDGSWTDWSADPETPREP
jgi:3-mercaptopyruvate sulfurtransferase SseA